MNSGIYEIKCNATNKVYIGQSIDVDNRLKTHLNELKNNNHCNKELQEDFNTYGSINFEFKIIASCEPEVLNCLEKYYIDKYSELNKSYNVKAGGAKDRKEQLLTAYEYKIISRFKDIDKIYISELEPILLLAQQIYKSGLYNYGKYKELEKLGENYLIYTKGDFNKEYMKRVISYLFAVMKLIINEELQKNFSEIKGIINWRVRFKASDFSKRFIVLACEVVKTGEKFENHIFF